MVKAMAKPEAEAKHTLAGAEQDTREEEGQRDVAESQPKVGSCASVALDVAKPKVGAKHTLAKAMGAEEAQPARGRGGRGDRGRGTARGRGKGTWWKKKWHGSGS